jgi:pyruvate formate lyase activating enzyme
MTPAQIVEEAQKSGARAIAYTYNEPTISFEYMIDTARLARKKGLKNVVVSAGYICEAPLKELLEVVDAYKIDLKGFNEKFYHELTAAHLAPVLENLKTIHKSGVHLEIVNLVIPGSNDSEKEIRDLCQWIKDNLGTDVPVHFTRFHPEYKLLNSPPTPVETVKRARRIAMEMGLKYVYTGNMDDTEGSTTYDPVTKEPLIVRQGFFIRSNKVGADGRTPSGQKIPGVWS